MQNYNINPMKRIAILLIVIFLPAVRSSAQNPKMEKLNNFKIGFFTKKLDMSSSEAEKFWPVYNEYQNKKNQLQLEKIKINRTFNQGENSLSDSQLTEMGDKYVECLVQESSLAVAFHQKLKEVLPPAKVIKYYQAEVQYKAELLNELQNIRQQQGTKARRDF
jgi:hypothetical protein